MNEQELTNTDIAQRLRWYGNNLPVAWHEGVPEFAGVFLIAADRLESFKGE